MRYLFIVLFSSVILCGQQFTVTKVHGDVKLLRGSSEKWEDVKVGQQLLGSDLIMTDTKSGITLKNDNGSFLIDSKIAIGLKNIKKMTLDELILSLAMEEIRNVPKNESEKLSKNTAVYGSEVKEPTAKQNKSNLGYLKLNGAQYLCDQGFKESAVIVSKEVFRNYPSLSSVYNNRIYFAKILDDLGLFEEAVKEYGNIENLNLTVSQKSELIKLKETASLNIVNN